MQTSEPEPISHERDDARSAMLRAARTVAERDGIENFTLSKVAREADLPRPVVFGQFVRKEDLLLCVADHYEPKQNRPAPEVSRARVGRCVFSFLRNRTRTRKPAT